MNFNDIDVHVTKEEILSKISEYDIFKKYIHNFIELDVSFMSELRNTDTANCRITDKYNSLIYKDFKDGSSYDCWNYIMKKYYCSFHECLNIIAMDFNIRKLEYKNEFIPVGIIPNSIKLNYIPPKEKSIIQIVSQPWNSVDFEYWDSYKIPLELLDFYNVFSAKTVFLIKSSRRVVFSYSKSNPCFAYKFENESGCSYKIYWPLSKDKKFKWMFSGGTKNDIEGLDQLPLSGDILILGKSLKDVMCYNMLGYNAISLQGEGNRLEQSLVDKLLKRFNKIIINYDNDLRGIKETDKLIEQYGFNHFYIDDYKDLSDWIKHNSLEQAKLMINDKVRAF